MFFPCSQWLYIQISANWSVLDDFISKQWCPMFNELHRTDIINKGFFIRYFDNTPQLRLRFQLKKMSNASSAIDLFYKSATLYINADCIWDISIRTYKRENLRYHYKLMDTTETLFCLDSMIVAQSIALSQKCIGDHSRVIVSALLTDMYLNAFDYTLLQKKSLLKEMALIYKRKYGFNKYNSKQFNVKYRIIKQEIEDALCGNVDDTFVTDIRNVYITHVDKIKKVCCSLLNGMELHRLNKNELLMSYIHMTFNRIFIARNQIFELLVYDFMTRCYSGLLARTNKQSPLY